MKQKILSILLMGILVIGLTGCGSKESEKINYKGNDSKELLSSKVKVGDYVSYNAGNDNSYTSSKDKTGFEQDQTFKTTGKEVWRVLNVDNGIVTLVSENPIKTSTNSPYQIDGGKAYLNIVDELNSISNIYGKGEYATSSRSITYDDIIKIIGYDVISEKYNLDLSNKSDEEKIDLIKKALANNNESSRNTNFGTQFSITDEKKNYVPSNDNEDGYTLGDTRSLTDNYIPSTNVYQYITKEEDKLSLAFGNNDRNFWLATTFVQKSGIKNDESSNYADKVNGTIDASEFNIIKESNNQKIEELQNKLISIDTEIANLTADKTKQMDKEKLFEEYKNINELNKVVLDAFVSKIIIGKPDSETTKRPINIEWNLYTA